MTLYALAHRHLGITEKVGAQDHPAIVWWLSMCDGGDNQHDETPWCSAFLNWLAWELDVPRTRSLAARSWLTAGIPIDLQRAVRGFDVMVLSRGDGPQPGPDVIAAPGHVGVFDHDDGQRVWLIGGNQGNAVSLAPFARTRVLGVRRLVPAWQFA